MKTLTLAMFTAFLSLALALISQALELDGLQIRTPMGALKPVKN